MSDTSPLIINFQQCISAAAYICNDTVIIEEDGAIRFFGVAEDKDLEIIFLAPELQQLGIVTEKVIPP